MTTQTTMCFLICEPTLACGAWRKCVLAVAPAAPAQALASLEAVREAHPNAYLLPLTVALPEGSRAATARSLTYEQARALFAERRPPMTSKSAKSA